MTIASLILELRELAHDTVDSNFIQEETAKMPGNLAPNGTGLIFRLQRRFIVGTDATTNSVYITQGTVFRSQSNFTVDLTNGIITFAAGHAPVAGVDVLVDYNFFWYTDTYYTEFLNKAAQLAGGYADPTLVVAGLVPAMLQYGLKFFYEARAAEYAYKFDSSASGAAQGVGKVTDNFRKLAETAMKDADNMRTAYNQRFGGRDVAASQQVTYKIDPITPPR